MKSRARFIILLFTTIILGFQCKTDSSDSGTSEDTLADPIDSLNRVGDKAHSNQRLNVHKKKLQIGMEVFYRRSGGMGDKRFSGLSDGDTIHYVKDERMTTQRVYQVTHNGTDSDSLQAINLSILSRGKVLKASRVDFRVQKRENHSVITFYDGPPESTADLVHISFNFIDTRTLVKEEVKIYMLLDLRLEDW